MELRFLSHLLRLILNCGIFREKSLYGHAVVSPKVNKTIVCNKGNNDRTDWRRTVAKLTNCNVEIQKNR